MISGGVHWCLVWSGWTTRPCYSWSCQVKVVLKWFGCSRCVYFNLVDIVALALVVDHLVDASVPFVALIAKRRQHRKELLFWALPKLGGPPLPNTILILFNSYFHQQRHHKWPSANFYYQNYHFHLFVNNAKQRKIFFVKRRKKFAKLRAEGGRCICIITIFPERRSQPTWTSRRSQRKNTFWKKIVVNSKSIEKMLSHQKCTMTVFYWIFTSTFYQ